MKSSTRSLTEGPLAKQILLVSLPLALSNLLQVLFNMSDVAVVGRFAGSTALGAVGSTSIFVTLFTGFLIGLGNGIMTIAIGTLPLLLFGPTGYGHRQGLLMVPARLLQAAAPFLFGLCVERWGVNALWLTALLALTAAITLACLRAPRRDGEPAP